MKSLINTAVILLTVAACTTTKPVVVPLSEHQKTIGAVSITYDSDGNWIKLVSSGVAPLHNKTTHSLAEASKIASMYAKRNIAEFMSNSFSSTHTSDIRSDSGSFSAASAIQEDGDLHTVTLVVEHIRSDSNQILKGIYITNQVISEDQVRVDVEVSRQSITAAQNISAQSGGLIK